MSIFIWQSCDLIWGSKQILPFTDNTAPIMAWLHVIGILDDKHVVTAIGNEQNKQTYQAAVKWYCYTGLILGLRPTNERRRYKVTASLNDWAQT